MGEGSYRGELVSALGLLILFIALLAGREAGNFYADYRELGNLKILLEVKEEDLSNYLLDPSAGEGGILNVGLTITLPEVDNTADIVIEMPDYIRRWLISVTLSPVTVRQPSLSDIELEILVEDESIINETYPFPKRKVSYIDYLYRELEIHANDAVSLLEKLEEATTLYSGEVKVELRGKAKAHLWVLDTWLPFSTTRYPLLTVPHLYYVDSEWRNQEGQPLSESETGKTAYVTVKFSNPTRLHTVKENITCKIYRGKMKEPLTVMEKEIPLASSHVGFYVFPFIPVEEGDYYYSLESRCLNLLSKEESSILRVKRP